MFFFVIYISTNGGHLDYYDGTSAFLMTEYFVLFGSPFYISEDLPSVEKTGFPIERHIRVQGNNRAQDDYDNKREYYSEQGITKDEAIEKYLQGLDKKQFPNGNYVVLPTIGAFFYLLSNLFQIDPIHFVPLVTNSVIMAISAVIIYKISELLFKSKKISFVTALIFGLTSFLWPYTETFLARPLAILFILLSIYFILHNKENKKAVLPFAAGICLGLAAVSHPILLTVVPGVIIYGLIQFRSNKKSILLFVIALSVIFLLLASVNYIRFGEIDQFGMSSIGTIADKKIKQDSLVGIQGYLFSPGRSIVLYFPIIVLYPLGTYCLYKQSKSLALLFLYISLVVILFTTISPRWDHTEWGSHRYHTPVIPFIAIAVGSAIMKFSQYKFMKVSVIFLSAIGFFVNFTASIVGYENALRYGRYIMESKIYGGGGFTWNVFYSPVIQPFNVISSNWLASKEFGLKIGHSFCNLDLYFYCVHGFLSIIVILVIILVILFSILYLLFNKNEQSKDQSLNLN